MHSYTHPDVLISGSSNIIFVLLCILTLSSQQLCQVIGDYSVAFRFTVNAHPYSFRTILDTCHSLIHYQLSPEIDKPPQVTNVTADT
jgi:hypothetical protein